MKANQQRYLMALSLGVRFALAACNAAAQPHPDAAPALSSLPASPASSASSSVPSARSTSAGADEGAHSGQPIYRSKHR